MTSAMFFLLFFSCLLQLQFADSLSQLCSRDVTRHMTATRQQTFTETIRERTSCGVLGWSRCTTYRTTLAYTTVTYLQPYTVQETSCCDGWAPAVTNNTEPDVEPCSIHNLPPRVLRCQTAQSVGGAATALERALITWVPPIFTEPHNFSLLVTSSENTSSARWHWGTYAVTYTAVSSNNNLSATCVMQFTVTPPSSTPNIGGKANNSGVPYFVQQLLYLTCSTAYSRQVTDLFWRINGSNQLPENAVVTKRSSAVDLFDTYQEFSSTLYILHTPQELHAAPVDCVSSLKNPAGAEVVTRVVLEARQAASQDASGLQLPFPAWVLAPALGGLGLVLMLVWLCLLARYPGCCSCDRLRRCRAPSCRPLCTALCDALLRPPEARHKPKTDELDADGIIVGPVTVRQPDENGLTARLRNENDLTIRYQEENHETVRPRNEDDVTFRSRKETHVTGLSKDLDFNW